MEDIKRINETLGSERFRKGVLKVAERRTFPSAKEAADFLYAFGGDGWLQMVESDGLVALKPSDTAAAGPCWPIAAERVKGSRSLHLVRTADGWTATVLEEADGEGLLETRELLGHDGRRLVYTVHWSLSDDGREWVPALSRLARVETKQGG